MPAPKGNEFWKKRSKHGRDKIFKTPEQLLEACYEYFEYQSQQTWVKIDYRGKDADRVELPVSSPFTLTGMCIFLGVNTQYFTDFSKICSKDFTLVITHVKEIIYTQKFEGATVGTYNSNIIARDLGLADSSNVKHAGAIKTTNDDYSKYSVEDLKAIEAISEKYKKKNDGEE